MCMRECVHVRVCAWESMCVRGRQRGEGKANSITWMADSAARTHSLSLSLSLACTHKLAHLPTHALSDKHILKYLAFISSRKYPQYHHWLCPQDNWIQTPTLEEQVHHSYTNTVHHSPNITPVTMMTINLHCTRPHPWGKNMLERQFCWTI